MKCRQVELFRESQDPIIRLRLLVSNMHMVKAREEKGYSQAELALTIKKSVMFISNVETLKILPSEEDMLKICIALEKPFDYLFPETLLEAVNKKLFEKRRSFLSEDKLVSLEQAVAEKYLQAPSQEEVIIERLNRQTVRGNVVKIMKEALTPREKMVVGLRYGFIKDPEGMTQASVAQELGVTRERIKQIEWKALRKLNSAIAKRSKEYHNLLQSKKMTPLPLQALSPPLM